MGNLISLKYELLSNDLSTFLNFTGLLSAGCKYLTKKPFKALSIINILNIN